MNRYEMPDEAKERALLLGAEQAVLTTYPNATSNRPVTLTYVRNPANENRVLLDQKGRPVTVDRLLATKPLRQDLGTRPGPGGRRLTYISGDGVSRSLNEIFGYEGWSLDIKSVTQMSKEKDQRGRWNVTYLAHVRITLVVPGTYKEDMGSGDSTDSSLHTAVSNAMKASITDALKRAARHFGEKLGNSLYNGEFSVNKAPTTLFQALGEYERHTKEKWGSTNVSSSSSNLGGGDNQCNSSVNTTANNTAAMPPPSAASDPSLPPSVTPNIANKPGNVYQRTSLGSHIPNNNTDHQPSTYATPRMSTGSMPVPAVQQQELQRQQQQPPMCNRPILTENTAAVNPSAAPLTAMQHLQAGLNGEPLQQQQPPARPASAWGKRPSIPPEGITDPNKRPRHNNPYV